ncbi:helix-hairpin-helix domain-containing protein [Ectobacillus polymachus]|uniref:helix-hairpin-helix domain-containing protein n=1 Tax=Ectobacillus polymachus TaxID=1508806 RepID=UPI003A88CA1A
MNIEKIKKWGMILVGALVVIGMFYSNTKGNQSQIPQAVTKPTVEKIEKTKDKSEPVKQENIVIDIKGAVKFEGVYEMSQGDRVQKAIEKAGGFLPEADKTKVNLAQFVQDQMLLYIPRVGEQGVAMEKQGKKKVAINIATKEDIESIVGIGPTKADSIIRYREQNGPFQKIEDLLKVNGIGEKTLEKMKEEIIVP